MHWPAGRITQQASYWANANWRVTFELENGNAFVLDYEDYH